jgi:hypothetical protein
VFGVQGVEVRDQGFRWDLESIVQVSDLTGRVVWYLVFVQETASNTVDVKWVLLVYVKLHPIPKSRFLGRQPLPSNLHDSRTTALGSGAEKYPTCMLRGLRLEGSVPKTDGMCQRPFTSVSSRRPHRTQRSAAFGNFIPLGF